DLETADWSAEACGVFGIDPAGLPEVRDCAGVIGETGAFGPPLPVAGLAVDQQAALLAEHCFTAGEAKCTYGTGAFLLATTALAPGCPRRVPGPGPGDRPRAPGPRGGRGHRRVGGAARRLGRRRPRRPARPAPR